MWVLLVEGQPLPAEVLPARPVGVLPEEGQGITLLLQAVLVDLTGPPQCVPPVLAADGVLLHCPDAAADLVVVVDRMRGFLGPLVGGSRQLRIEDGLLRARVDLEEFAQGGPRCGQLLCIGSASRWP